MFVWVILALAVLSVLALVYSTATLPPDFWVRLELEDLGWLKNDGLFLLPSGTQRLRIIGSDDPVKAEVVLEVLEGSEWVVDDGYLPDQWREVRQWAKEERRRALKSQALAA